MSLYIYKAKSGPAQVIEGLVEADSRRVAMEKLSSMGYFPIRLDEKVREGAAFGINSLWHRVPGKDLGLFSRQLSDLLDAGMPLLKALKTVQQQVENSRLARIVVEMTEMLEQGEPLSDSIKKFPDVFSPVYGSLVRAGESSGSLATAFDRLSEFAEQEDELRTKVQAALAYPFLIAGVGVATVIFLLMTVIPRLADIFSEMGQDLPLPTRVLLATTGFLGGYGGLTVLTTLTVGIMWIVKSRVWSAWVDRLPLWRTVARKLAIARFSRTMGTLLGNGVPMLNALDVAKDIFREPSARSEIRQVANKVEQGMSLSQSFRESTVFPVFVSNMVAVGEEGDRLDISLRKVAVTYEREADRALKLFTSLLEPMMVLLIGGVIGLIVIAMLLPVFEISTVLK